MDKIQKILIKAGRKDLAQEYYLKIGQLEQLLSLNDALIFQKGLATGSTEIWYMKSHFIRDGMMGYEWLKEHNKLPDVKNLEKTHHLLGKIKETDPEEIFKIMQGENWSPHGEAKHLILSKGLNHTSMSMGDIVVSHGKTFIADYVGFEVLA